MSSSSASSSTKHEECPGRCGKIWTCLECNGTLTNNNMASVQEMRKNIAFICLCCEHQFVCLECYKKNPSKDWSSSFGSDHMVYNFLNSVKTVFVSPDKANMIEPERQYERIEPAELVSAYMAQPFTYVLIHVCTQSKTTIPLNALNEDVLKTFINLEREKLKRMQVLCKEETTLSWGIEMRAINSLYIFQHSVPDASINVLVPQLMEIVEHTRTKLAELLQQ